MKTWLTMKQNEQEWLEYESVMQDVYLGRRAEETASSLDANLFSVDCTTGSVQKLSLDLVRSLGGSFRCLIKVLVEGFCFRLLVCCRGNYRLLNLNSGRRWAGKEQTLQQIFGTS